MYLFICHDNRLQSPFKNDLKLIDNYLFYCLFYMLYFISQYYKYLDKNQYVYIYTHIYIYIYIYIISS